MMEMMRKLRGGPANQATVRKGQFQALSSHDMILWEKDEATENQT